MADPFIVFFDTFSVDEQSKNNLNYIRFTSCVELSEIRIIPFGSVIESGISDEAIIGATNPASFDLKFFGYKLPTDTILTLISEHHYSESCGIDSIKFSPPVPTIFLLLRGNYSTITLAVFGSPYLQLQPPALPTPNFSVPPPNFNQPETHNSPCEQNLDPNLRSIKSELIALSSQNSRSPIIQAGQDAHWSSSAGLLTSDLSSKQTFDTHTYSVNVCEAMDVNEVGIAEDASIKASSENGAAFEDGEIQENDYETISSNDDLFSESEEAEASSITAKNLALAEQTDPRLEECRWKFDPRSLLNCPPTSLPGINRLRLSDPMLTLFETYCWFLSKCHQQETDSILPISNAELNTTEIMQPKYEKDEVSPLDKDALLAPPSTDSTQAKLDADFLLNASDQFGIEVSKFDSSWVLIIEKLADVISSGLAHLALQEKDAYDFVITCLLVWTYAGLDLDTALNQPDANFVLRHLRAGIELTGLILSTTCEEICEKFLLPTDWQPCDTIKTNSSNQRLQIQDVLLDLLESPIMATPLKIAIVEALDRSLRLPIGFDAFLNRSTNRTCKRESGTSDVESVQTKIKPESKDTKQDIDVSSVDETPLQLTPYQRFVFFVSSNKSTHVSVACQRLLNKVHTYELLLELDDFMENLKKLKDPYSFPEMDIIGQTLQAYLSEIENVIQNASTLISNPGKSLKGSFIQPADSKCQNDPYPTLCRLLISTRFIQNLLWVLETLLSHDFPKIESEAASSKSGLTCILATCIPLILRCLSKLINHPCGIMIFVADAHILSRILKCLLSPMEKLSDLCGLQGIESCVLYRMVLLGFNLATKLEAIQHIDRLIAISRKKGVTGVHAYISSRIQREQAPIFTSFGESDPIYDSLFGLARLFLSDGTVSSMQDTESVHRVSLAPWVAQILSWEDYFLPCLMLLEAYNNAGKTSDSDTKPTAGDPSTKLEESQSGISEKTPGESSKSRLSSSNLPTGQRRTFLSRLGYSIYLDLSNILSTICIGLLRYAEDPKYLDQFGPRLMQLVKPTSWEDSVVILSPATVFSHYRRFCEIASGWLYWLREMPSGPFSSPLACSNAPGEEGVFAWLIEQLQPLSDDLQKALDSAVSMDIAEDLVKSSSNAPSQLNYFLDSSWTASHAISPALLLLLRFIRSHILPPLSEDQLINPIFADKTYIVMPKSVPKSISLLARRYAIIELYSQNGLGLMSTITTNLSEYLLLICQAFPYLPLDNNIPCDGELLFSMLAPAVEILAEMISLLSTTVREEFRDTTPVPALCLAYTAAIYLGHIFTRSHDSILRVRNAVLAGISSYSTAFQETVDPEASKMNLWSNVCRNLLSFTVSSPKLFFAGVQLLLDLLPLPLPIETSSPLSPMDQKKLLSSRDWWSHHLLCLPVELCGMIELLSPSANPLLQSLQSLVDRIANLSAPLSTMLVDSAVDVLIYFFSSIEPETDRGGFVKDEVSGDPPNASGSDLGKIPDSDISSSSLLTSGGKLILGQQFQGLLLNSNDLAGVHSPQIHCSGDPVAANFTTTPDSVLKSFSDISDPQDIVNALYFLRTVLSQSTCKQAFLDQLRLVCSPSMNDSSASLYKYTRILAIFANILSCCTDNKPHVAAQSLLIECLDHLLDPELGIPAPSDLAPAEKLRFDLANHLPNNYCINELVRFLLGYLDQTDRDLVSAPPVLQILYRLSIHDFGFAILQAQITEKRHERVFTSVIKRVNDCFSADNPDCRATLVFFFRLISALLGDAIFAEDANLASASLIGQYFQPLNHISEFDDSAAANSPFCLSSRHLRLSSSRLNQLLRWTSQETENPVRDLTSLLEILSDDDPSLKPLHDGMKSLSNILTLAEKTSMDDEQDEAHLQHVILLPEPTPFDELFAKRQTFRVTRDPSAESASDFKPTKLDQKLDLTTSNSLFYPHFLSIPSKTCTDIPTNTKMTNLVDICNELCPGLQLRDELVHRLGRRHSSDAGATTHHQKRRKGQSSIIQTGRSSKKYVAPMRGRGFIIRGAGAGSSVSSLLGPANAMSAGVTSTGLLGSVHRPDIFRSRTQNTSRPPSLHVDDFNKLEKDDVVGSERSFSRDDSLRFRPFRDNRSLRGMPTGLLSSSLMPGSQVGASYRQGPRVLSTLPFVGTNMPGVPNLMQQSLMSNWAVQPLNLLPIANPYRTRQSGLLSPRHD